MAYLRAYQAAGDPFLGGLLKGIVGLGKGIIGKVTGLGGGGGVSKGALQDAMRAALAKGGQVAGKFPGGKKGAALAGGALAAGGLAGAAAEHFMGGGRRRYRRMDVGNTRALRRAMRRVQGFAHLAHQTISFTKTTHLKKRGRKR